MAKRGHSTTTRYLDRVKEQLKLPSDYALAEVLGLTTQAIYKMRSGGAMSVTTAARVAELLELDPLKVIAESEMERGGDADLWKRIARRAAVVLLGAVGMNLAAPPAPASAAASPSASGAGPVYYVKRRRRALEGFAVLQLLRTIVAL